MINEITEFSESIVNDTAIDFTLGSIIGLAAWFFGGLDGFVKVLLTFTVIDYLSGIAVAMFVKHNLSSAAGFKGISRKCLMFAFVGIAHVLDKYMFGDMQALRTAVCLFYISNEGFSLIENADALGVPFPKALKDKFLALKEAHEDKKTEHKER